MQISPGTARRSRSRAQSGQKKVALRAKATDHRQEASQALRKNGWSADQLGPDYPSVGSISKPSLAREPAGRAIAIDNNEHTWSHDGVTVKYSQNLST